MSSDVIPFPTGKRVNSEQIWVWWGLYYRLESVARRIHFLLEVERQQNNPISWRTYPWIRKRTIKRCFLVISQKWKLLEERIHLLRKDDAYIVAIRICLDLLKKQRDVDDENMSRLEWELLWSQLQTDNEHILTLLTGFGFTYWNIVQVLSEHIKHKIKWYDDDVYAFLKRIPKFPIQDS